MSISCIILILLSLGCALGTACQAAEYHLLKVIQHEPGAEAIAFSPDNKTLAVCGLAGPVLAYDTSSWHSRLIYHNRSESARTLAYSLDGRFFAIGLTNGRVLLFSSKSYAKKATFVGHHQQTKSLTFSKDGTMLSSGGSLDHTVQVWRTSDRVVTRSLSQRSYSNFLGFLLNDSLIAFPSGNAVGFYSTSTWQKARSIELPADSVQIAGAISASGRTLAISDNFGNVEIWDVVNHQKIQALKLNNTVTALALSPDGKSLVTANAESYKILQNPFGKVRVASDITLSFWDTTSWQVVKHAKAHLGMVNSLAYSPDGSMLATASDDSIKIWLRKA